MNLVIFNPEEIGLADRYVDDRLLYNEMISPTKIYLSRDKVNK